MQIQILDPTLSQWSEILQQLRHDFYHLPGYLQAEANRIQAIPEAIVIEADGAIFFLPYLLRQYHPSLLDPLNCLEQLNQTDRLVAKLGWSPRAAGAPTLKNNNSDIFDVISPYGYPGILLNQAAIDRPEFIKRAMRQLIQQFQAKQVCSAFLRLHPILNQRFPQLYDSEACTPVLQTVSIDLTRSEAELWQQTRSVYRNLIRKGERAGFVAKMVDFESHIDLFLEIYQETMDRVQATSSFYFDRSYLEEFALALGERLHLCLVEFQQYPVCVGLFTESCGIVQYHLSGTRTEFLKQSPTVILLNFVRAWAKARGNQVMHLGGGVGGAQDNLYHFKAGFSSQTHLFPILRLITHEPIYQRLVEAQARALNLSTEQLLQQHFFPAYRFQALLNPTMK